MRKQRNLSRTRGESIKQIEIDGVLAGTSWERASLLDLSIYPVSFIPFLDKNQEAEEKEKTSHAHGVAGAFLHAKKG